MAVTIPRRLTVLLVGACLAAVSAEHQCAKVKEALAAPEDTPIALSALQTRALRTESQSGFCAGITISQFKPLQVPGGCSDTTAYVILKAAISGGSIGSYSPGAGVCFKSNITIGSRQLFDTRCFALLPGAVPPSIVNPIMQPLRVDPGNLKGLMVGFAFFQCKLYEDCPAKDSMYWELSAVIESGEVEGLDRLRWQYSPTAFTIEPGRLDLDSILVYTGGSTCLGYPTSQLDCHVGGANGGGGSNYCGSNSATGSVCAAPPPSVQTTPTAYPPPPEYTTTPVYVPPSL